MRAEVREVHVIRLDPGEEVLSTIAKRAKELGVNGGAVFAIGGVSRARVGVFDLEKGVYRERVVEGFHEVASLIGNISIKEDGTVFPHIHVVLASEGQVVAGHLLEATVEPTLEVFLLALDRELKRALKTPYGFTALDV